MYVRFFEKSRANEILDMNVSRGPAESKKVLLVFGRDSFEHFLQ